jgi:hypothetical protein
VHCKKNFKQLAACKSRIALTKEELRAKVCHVCGTTEDLAACPACHWWFCKKHDLHECTPEPQNPASTDYAKSRPTRLWYLFPFFFALLGGVIAYFAIRNDDREMAEGMLIFGTLMFLFDVALTWIMILR